MGVIRVVALILLLVLGLFLVVHGLRWLWRTATGKVEEVDGEVVTPPGWKGRLPGMVLVLFLLLGTLLVADRIFNTPPSGRHYQPATLGEDGRVQSGKTY